MPSCRPGLNLREKPSYGRENCDALQLEYPLMPKMNRVAKTKSKKSPKVM